MAARPKISCIMSVRNGDMYLKEAIDSILKQNYPDFEFIIINDYSSDKTKEILNSYRDKRIKLYHNKKHLGLTASLNIALSIAKGDYIARMDGDDISLPLRFLKQVRFLDKNPSTGVCGTGVYLIDGKSKIIGRQKFPITNRHIRKVIFKYNPVRHSSVMFRKTLYEKLGGYDQNLDGAEDYDLWMRYGKFTKMANLPDNLVKYRIHSSRVSAKEEKKVLLSAIKCRLKAIRVYKYSILNFPYIVLSYFSMMLPKFIKDIFLEKAKRP